MIIIYATAIIPYTLTLLYVTFSPISLIMCEEKSVCVGCTQIHTEGMISQEMWLALNDLTVGKQDTVSRSGPYY